VLQVKISRGLHVTLPTLRLELSIDGFGSTTESKAQQLLFLPVVRTASSGSVQVLGYGTPTSTGSVRVESVDFGVLAENHVKETFSWADLKG
jgi:hypothetical protein